MTMSSSRRPAGEVRPGLGAMLVLSSALILFGACTPREQASADNKADAAVSETGQALESAGDKAEALAKTAAEKGKAVAKDVAPEAKELASTAGDKLNKLADATGNAVLKAGDKVSDVVHDDRAPADRQARP